MRTIFLHTIAEDLQADAANIKQPCLLIWGENDDATPVADGRILHSAIRDSQFVVVSRAGHFVYTDKPDEVTKIIEDFL
jgi:pimeloyl-ACP methyl ester carboxylesterase